mmetsp:Transcript_46103/g.107798  ORF Transcript_46103/g.107798 Transcript_46103/m.107798 type:complete len:232 (-) Transcript_46103:18-713(-)
MELSILLEPFELPSADVSDRSRRFCLPSSSVSPFRRKPTSSCHSRTNQPSCPRWSLTCSLLASASRPCSRASTPLPSSMYWPADWDGSQLRTRFRCDRCFQHLRRRTGPSTRSPLASLQQRRQRQSSPDPRLRAGGLRQAWPPVLCTETPDFRASPPWLIDARPDVGPCCPLSPDEGGCSNRPLAPPCRQRRRQPARSERAPRHLEPSPRPRRSRTCSCRELQSSAVPHHT